MINFYRILIIILFASCNNQKPHTEADKKAFEEMAHSYQINYTGGSINCEQILAAMNEETKMWENGNTWTFSDLKKYCPHLPKKNVIETYNNQKLINNEVGYDFVSQLYISQHGDTIRETISRIWKKTDNAWKISVMNNLISKE